MSETIHCDIAIIGAGAAGLNAASGAAQMGARVVLVESGKMGGDCLNYGCVPSKSLLAAAKAFYHAQHANHFGIQSSHSIVNFAQVMQHVKNVIGVIAKNDSVERFESLGIKVIRTGGKFIDPNTLQAGSVEIKAKRFIVATGSFPFVPPIPGLDQAPYETNETIFDLTEQPKHLVVIGGGPIGAELAQAFAMLGSKVTLLEGFKILPKDEADCAAIVKAQLQASGVTLYEGLMVNHVEKKGDQIIVMCEQNGGVFTVAGSHVLVAAGRRANVHNLDLEKAGIEYSSKGINVNKRLRTTNRKVFAIGDVTGSFQFTHVAGYHAGIVLKNVLFRLPAKVNYKAVPWVTYTDPELAHAGLLTEEAKEQGIDIQITEWLFADNDRAQAESQPLGKIKILTNKKARILGVTIVGPHAGELLLPWVMAIREKKTLRSFTDVIAPYPTLSEISKQGAGKFYTPMLFSNKIRRLVRWLMKLG